MDLELEVIDVREGGQYSLDESDGNEETGGKGKRVKHMDASQTQENDFVALQVMGSNADELDYIDSDATAIRNIVGLQAPAASADGVDHMDPVVTESHGLIPLQIPNGNGEMMAMGTEGQQNGGSRYPSQENILRICGIAELNDRVRLWMTLVLIFVIIAVVIVVTLAVSAAIYVDEDEQFNCSLFKIPHYFNGSFNIPPSASYNESQVSADLQQKLADLYRSSHALGCYFSKAEIYALRNNSVEYKLTFVLPEEEQEELRNFTLSREMVHNVFRQFLYDQDPVEPGGMRIDKASLKISSVYLTDVHKQTEEKA